MNYNFRQLANGQWGVWDDSPYKKLRWVFNTKEQAEHKCKELNDGND